MGWFEEEFVDLKKKMKWGFRDLNYPEERRGVLTPLVNIKENERDVVVKVKLPEVSRRNVSLKITSDSVEVNAEKGQVKYYRMLALPNLVDHNRAQVNFKEGVLRIVLPRLRRTIKFKLRKR